MESNIMRLMASYLLAGFLVFLLIQLRRDPERRRALGFKSLLGRFFLAVFIFYAFPLIAFLSYHCFKVVIVQKYTTHQFKLYAISVLFNEFNGYYLAIWNWVKNQLRL
ncbi:MAG: hypothetical protein WBB86_02110 [Candidatus Omnitrophota bacterium]